MTPLGHQHAELVKERPVRQEPSLRQLHALVEADLARVDALILARVQSDIPMITELAKHIVASGGKRIRPALTLVCARLCGYDGDRHLALAASIEFIHTATLLHDDVVDESKLRRGTPTANELWGNKASVLVGDYLLGQSFQMMVGSDSLSVLRILSEAATIIAKGEVMQLMAARDPDTTQEHYLEIVTTKTAALFAAACELGAEVSGRAELAGPLNAYGKNLGIAFQLVDDALDYSARQDKLGKSLGDDFREGKITLPAIIAYARGDAGERSFWRRTLKDLRQGPEDFLQACQLIRAHKGVEETVALADTYATKAREHLKGFKDSPEKSALLETVDFCVWRAY